MIDRVQLVKDMKKALDLPESFAIDIGRPLCPITSDEILSPDGFDLKLGRQLFHFNLRNNPKLSEKILKADAIPLKTRNEVVALIAKENARRQAESRGEFSVKGVTFKMLHVTGGTFLMGSNSGGDAEIPVHEVRVNSFYIGQTQVTQELWESVMGTNPSEFKGNKKPVECVSWNDCQTFIQKLNQLTGKQFRLPTEAEWEFAARGGTQSKGYTYSGGNNIEDVAWYDANSDDITHDVATKYPNELGIYDMSGNVWEWCYDWYDRDYYSSNVVNNPVGPSLGSYRVHRGGSWNIILARNCRVSNRGNFTPDYRGNDLGLRLAL